MSDALLNERATRGNNEAPDYAKEVTDRMAAEYAELERTVGAMLDEARAMPPEVSDENLPSYVSIIKRLRDTKARIEATHEAEKQPFLRGGQGVDGFFFTLWEKVTRRQPKGKAGAADVLQARVDDFMQRKRAAEEAERRRKFEEAERVRVAAEAEQRRKAEEAEAARLAAERARKPETQEAKGAVAQQAEVEADSARVDTLMASDKAEQAQIAALASPADMTRTRLDEGMVTMAKNPQATVTNYGALDMNVLRPYIKRDELDKAVRQWARNTGFQEEMPGVLITDKPKTVIR